MKLVLLSQDLMMVSRIEGAARQCGLTTSTANNQQAACDAVSDPACRVLLVDLQLSGLDIGTLVTDIRSLDQQHLPIIAFGPHVHEAKLSAAVTAGCDKVVSRGQLDRELSQLLQSAVNLD